MNAVMRGGGPQIGGGMPPAASGSGAQQQQQQQQQQQPQPQPRPALPSRNFPNDRLATAVAANDKPTVRNLLGEQLFPKVQIIMGATPLSPGVTTGKITGMLLELDHQEIIGMLEDNAALEKKISEAGEVLRAASASGAFAPPGGR